MAITFAARVLTRPVRFIQTVDASVCGACSCFLDDPTTMEEVDREFTLAGLADLARRIVATEIVVTEVDADARVLGWHHCVICGQPAMIHQVEMDLYI